MTSVVDRYFETLAARLEHVRRSLARSVHRTNPAG